MRMKMPWKIGTESSEANAWGFPAVTLGFGSLALGIRTTPLLLLELSVELPDTSLSQVPGRSGLQSLADNLAERPDLMLPLARE